jgi:hypothetical protein
MKKIVPAALISLTFGSTQVLALSDLQINGFLSVAAAWSDVNFLTSGAEPVYISHIRKPPSFDKDTNIGIQITKYLREDVSITTQLLAEAANDFEVEATWAFLKWEPNDKWQFRVGRLRTNPYMLSEYVNVGYAYPWVRPPQEVYSQIPASFSNFTGLDARYKMVLWHHDLSVSAFFGGGKNELEFPVGPNNTIFDEIDTRFNKLWSFNLRYGDEVFSLRAGFETTHVTLGPNAGNVMQNLNTAMNTLVGFGLIETDYLNYFTADNIQASFMGVGYQFDWKNVVSMAEIVKRHATTPIVANAIGWYVMGGYRVQDLLPNITFARERLVDNKVRRFSSLVNQTVTAPIPFGFGFPTTLDNIAQALINTSPYFDGGAGDQSSVTLGLRWDVYQGIAIKGEYQHVHPDRHSPGLFDIYPHKSVNIYSIAVDAVM